MVIGSLLISVLLYKNYILSGYFLYPFNKPDLVSAIWKVPADWNESYRKGIVSWGLNDKMDVKAFYQVPANSFNRLLNWLTRGGYKGYMNKLLFINFLAALMLFIYEGFRKKRRVLNKDLGLLLVLLVISVLEWYLLSQYRLLLATQVILAGLVASMLYSNLHWDWPKGLSIIGRSNFPLTFALVLFGGMAFVPFSILSKESRNKQITQSNGFTSNYLIHPWTGSVNEPKDSIMVDSIAIHFYPNQVYCWDCPLPCRSLSQQKIVYENFGYRIKALGKRVEDGFCLERENKDKIGNEN